MPWRMIATVIIATAIVACASETDARGARSTATSAASAATADSTLHVTDDNGHVVTLPGPAHRVISLIPSATESIIALGASDRIVGRTRYDVAPQVASLPNVGGGIDPSVEAIVALHPDLVIAWNTDKRQIARAKLVALGVPVFTMRTEDTTDVFRGIANLGKLLGRDTSARRVVASIHRDLDEVRRSVAGQPTPSVFYVVYNDPPMTAGSKTFIGQLLGIAGGRSIFADLDALWPQVPLEEIIRRDPDLLVVPIGEFKTNSLEHLRARSGWRDLRAVREGHVVTVPSDLLSRPGANIGEAARALRTAMHPTLAAGVTR
ncbi:MAG: btuF [Gemmatimonadetes bacterium]|nr:btuF [Gemmatimonadota bacterium]